MVQKAQKKSLKFLIKQVFSQFIALFTFQHDCNRLVWLICAEAAVLLELLAGFAPWPQKGLRNKSIFFCTLPGTATPDAMEELYRTGSLIPHVYQLYLHTVC